MKHRARWIAALLCSFTLTAALWAKKSHPANDPASEQKRALHALDRLTFGPRPGDVQAVTAMGVDNWIELQLHPDKIENSALDARLSPYRTLHMSSRELAANFPPPQVLKAVQDGKLPMPHEAYQRAIYSANLVRLEEKKEARQTSGLTNAAASAQQATLGTAVDASGREGNRSTTAMNTSAMATNPSGAAPSQKQAADSGDAMSDVDRRQRRVLIDQLTALEPAARMSRILALPPEQQSGLTRGLPEPKRQALLAGLSPEQRETVMALSNPVAVVDGELQSAKLLRTVYSDRQLEEVLADFWFNHFNVYMGKGADRYLVTSYEREVIRPHVLGKFKDLLVATAQSPAILFYLDNWQSVGPDSDEALGIKSQNAQPQRRARGPWANGPFGTHPVAYPQPRPQRAPTQAKPQAQGKRRNGLNENYARELMELHTLGVNGGYTQKDVTEVARVFTGWTLQDPRDGGGFVFKPRLHEPGVKTVLGHKIKENGEKEGYEVLNLLAKSPATARFISTKLATRFVSDDPPKSLIDAMSKTFLKTDGDLREVLRTMFRSPEFWAPEAYNAKVKTPLEFVASSLRATQVDISDPLPLVNTLNQMGMPLYGMQPPTGYSSKADAWVNSAALLARMNFALTLVNNKVYGTVFDIARLAPAGEDPYQVQVRLEQVLLNGDVSAQTHQTIEDKTAGSGANVIAALLLGSPEFQRR